MKPSQSIIEQIAAEIPLLSAANSGPGLRLVHKLRELARAEDLPPATRELAWQAIDVVQRLLAAKEPDLCLLQLSELLDLLAQDDTAPTPVPAPAPNLVLEFLRRQPAALEQFEGACLMLAEGDPAAPGALQRQLHMWKGDGGLAGLDDLAQAMHALEAEFAGANRLAPEALAAAMLELCDRLREYFSARARGRQTVFDPSEVLAQLRGQPGLHAQARVFRVPAGLDPALMTEFGTESLEHLAQADAALTVLAASPYDDDALHTLYRAFHAVKGMAAFVGHSAVIEVALRAEQCVQRFLSGELPLGEAQLVLVRRAVRVLRRLMATLPDALAGGIVLLSPEDEALLHRLEQPAPAPRLPAVRRVPLRAVCEKLARHAEQLAAQAGKAVTCPVDSEAIVLEHAAAEAVEAALLHLVRNAVDHGIETADIREQQGKPRAGQITLSVRHTESAVVLSIADDGRGLDRERIGARARAQGLSLPERELTEAELVEIILQPGFSTAEHVTELSGRGLGLDVVRSIVEVWGGLLRVNCTPGRGTTVTLELPHKA